MAAAIEYRRATGAPPGRRRRIGPGLLHAVPSGEPAAACGFRPAAGWAIERGDAATCPACRRKLGSSGFSTVRRR